MKLPPPVITRYIAAYNAKDVDAMVALLEPGVSFTNVQHGEATLSVSGVDKFRQVAASSAEMFATRKISVQRVEQMGGQWIAEIAFEGALAKPAGGRKAGEAVSMRGLMMFHTHGERIATLVDVS